MDARTATRIDSLYRNVKSFPLLVVLSIFVPILLLFIVPLSLAYLYLRAKLLRDIDAGRILLDELSGIKALRPMELSASQKVDFIRHHTFRLWAPNIILVMMLLLGIGLAIYLERFWE